MAPMQMTEADANPIQGLSVDLQVAAGGDELTGLDVEDWARAAVRSVGAEPAPGSLITVRIVGAEEGTELNKEFRDRDGPTNVLAFPAAQDLPPEIIVTDCEMGDLVICLPVVQKEASDQGKSLVAHMAHMVVHGVIHLLGYDHQNKAEAEAMEALETEALQSLGFSDPYVLTIERE
jgi:probable rRNA maturation factor